MRIQYTVLVYRPDATIHRWLMTNDFLAADSFRNRYESQGFEVLFIGAIYG